MPLFHERWDGKSENLYVKAVKDDCDCDKDGQAFLISGPLAVIKQFCNVDFECAQSFNPTISARRKVRKLGEHPITLHI